MYNWRKIYRMVIEHRGPFFLVQLLALLATIASIPTPLLMPLLVDEVLLHKPGRLVETIQTLFGEGSPLFYTMVVLIVTLLLRASYVFFQILQTKTFQKISKEITYRIRKDVLTHLQKVSMEEYESLGSGKVASRLVTDIDTIDSFLSASISKLLVSVLSLVGVCVVLLLIHWQLALFIIFLNPLVVLFSAKMARGVARLKREQNRLTEVFQNALVETLEVFEQIRAANKERYFLAKLLSSAKELKERSIDYAYKSDAAARLSFFIFVAGFEIFRAAGILTVAYSDLSIGLMMAIFGYLWFMMTPIQEIINIQYAKKSADVALQRINELLRLHLEPQFPHEANPFASDEPIGIEIDRLTFAYPNKEPVLRDLSLVIPAGKISAIVGASGSGKTTLARLLVGFYAPQKGDILYNRISYRRIGLDVIREHVALVLQSPVLFNDTILFNVTLGREYPKERVEEALKMAQIYDLVRRLPEGLLTVVGRGGVRLSGGERQRIAIARMILQDPKVVILDESTSALDMETEQLLFCALEDFLSRRTTILIAHRPSTIEKADMLFFLKEGKLWRQMSFEEYQAKSRQNLCIL